MALPSDLASYVPLNSQHGTPSHTAEIKHISAQTWNKNAYDKYRSSRKLFSSTYTIWFAEYTWSQIITVRGPNVLSKSWPLHR
jgi:hypothetical protein